MECSLCKVSFESRSKLNRHLQTKKHAKMERYKRMMESESRPRSPIMHRSPTTDAAELPHSSDDAIIHEEYSSAVTEYKSGTDVSSVTEVREKEKK